jgi:7-carboxy-7-deazaguanine synthase
MFGQNPKRPPEYGNGDKLKVQSIFLTIQGEGVYSGHPAIFIRLGGCNLACSFCDTEFESFNEVDLDEILNQVRDLKKDNAVKLIVISGGEPFRQSIEKLCRCLISDGFEIQIETNGTLYTEIPDEVKVVCSPKITNSKYSIIRPELKKHLIAYKFLISNSIDGYSKLPDWNFDGIPVYLQAIDEIDEEKNKLNQKLVMDLAIKKGYIFSIQMHKILGIE